MARPAKYASEAERKAADAERKRAKRADDPESPQAPEIPEPPASPKAREVRLELPPDLAGALRAEAEVAGYPLADYIVERLRAFGGQTPAILKDAAPPKARKTASSESRKSGCQGYAPRGTRCKLCGAVH